MIITNCPRCGAMNATTTCNKCGWSQFNKSTVSTGARVVEWEEEMSESAEMECKRCGDNEDRIDGFCSKECKDKYSLEEALSKMNIRIAELEADKELLNSCESALISMVQQFFYSKAGENIFRHSFMSAEEEAAEYLVEHGIARWVGKNKSAICFNEVQE